MAHPIRTPLGLEFAKQTRGRAFREVRCFRALLDSIKHVKNGANVTEYHGRRSWVSFSGDPRWTDDPIEVCELSDLCIVWYRTIPRIEGRVTFLQAKYSSSAAHDPCTNWSTSVNEAFLACTWQWYLLNRRCAITGFGRRFQPPVGLLRDALLASVGSFGIFHHPAPGGPASFFYGSAAVVQSLGMVKGANRGHMLACGVAQQQVAGYDEKLWCCCLETFSDALFSGTIGTPFQKRGNGAANGIQEVWNNAFLSYLAGDIISKAPSDDANWAKFNTAFEASAPTDGSSAVRSLARYTLLIDGDAFRRAERAASIIG